MDKGTRMYAGIFRQGTGASGSWFTNNLQDFLRQWASSTVRACSCGRLAAVGL